MIERNTGADLLPFASRPSYPEARLKALLDTQERREREAARPFDADRLRADIRALDDPRAWTEGHDGDLAAELRRRGWTDERLDAAQAALRDDLQKRVHPPMRPPVTAAAAASSPSGRAGKASSNAAAVTSPGSTPQDRRGRPGTSRRRWPWSRPRDRVAGSGGTPRASDRQPASKPARQPVIRGRPGPPGTSNGPGDGVD